MRTFKIYWDCGYGKSDDEFEAETEAEAVEEAYERCLEEATSNWDYGVESKEA